MSRTYDIGCDQCKKHLWIGQHSQRRGLYIYASDDERMAALNAFLTEHLGHPLRVEGDEGFLDDGWVSVDFGPHEDEQ